jgi:hypothetical protein
MSQETEYFRRIVAKACEKSGGDVKVTLRRIRMLPADLDSKMVYRYLAEETIRDVLAAHPEWDNERVAAEVTAVLRKRAESRRWWAEHKDNYRKFGSLDIALACAAADAHPDWGHDDKGTLHYRGKEPNQNPMKLCDWFEATYPERVDRVKLDFLSGEL